MLNRKTIYICRDNDNGLMSKTKGKLKIILLKEDIFIRIIKINKKDSVRGLIKENINSTFRYYDGLTHYEKVKFKDETYLIIYFIKYYNALKEIIAKSNDIYIKPYEFTKEFKNKSKGLNINIRRFRENIYLVTSINKTVVYTKSFNIEEDINCYILECLEYLKEIFVVDDFVLFIEGSLYNNALNKLTKNIKFIKGKVS
ncbi:MAG: hypothetical protein Q4B63_05880 [Clostridium perfringens]|nr:hypothetical protein [Clostridium perfringens]